MKLLRGYTKNIRRVMMENAVSRTFFTWNETHGGKMSEKKKK